MLLSHTLSKLLKIFSIVYITICWHFWYQHFCHLFLGETTVKGGLKKTMPAHVWISRTDDTKEYESEAKTNSIIFYQWVQFDIIILYHLCPRFAFGHFYVDDFRNPRIFI